jgi:hypothetical protein
MKKDNFFIPFLIGTVFISSFFGFGIFSILVYFDSPPLLAILLGFIECALCQTLYIHYWQHYIKYDSELE